MIFTMLSKVQNFQSSLLAIPIKILCGHGESIFIKTQHVTAGLGSWSWHLQRDISLCSVCSERVSVLWFSSSLFWINGSFSHCLKFLEESLWLISSVMITAAQLVRSAASLMSRMKNHHLTSLATLSMISPLTVQPHFPMSMPTPLLYTAE